MSFAFSFWFWWGTRPVSGPARQSLTFLAIFFLFANMPRAAMAKTVTLVVKEIPQDLSRVALVELLRERFKTWVLKAVQFLPGMRAQLTFDSTEAKLAIEKQEFVFVGIHKCPILGGGPRGENVLVFHYPYERDEETLKTGLNRFGSVLSVRHQSYPSVDVHTGTRLVRMVRNGRIPRFLNFGDHQCKVWYRGQPIKCDICGRVTSLATAPLRASAIPASKRGILLGIVQTLVLMIGTLR